MQSHQIHASQQIFLFLYDIVVAYPPTTPTQTHTFTYTTPYNNHRGKIRSFKRRRRRASSIPRAVNRSHFFYSFLLRNVHQNASFFQHIGKYHTAKGSFNYFYLNNLRLSFNFRKIKK